jgi:integrase
MAAGRRKDVDLTGVRQRGGTFKVRVFGGTDPVTGEQVILTGSADTQDAAVELRDGFRKQVRERTGPDQCDRTIL